MDYSYVLTSYVVEFTFTAFQIAAWYRRREQTNCVRPRRHHRYGSGCLKRRSTELTQLDVSGSYTFAKTLEYKAKQNLNAGKEVTVVPPHEYQERFVHAMDEYLLACPGMIMYSAFASSFILVFR